MARRCGRWFHEMIANEMQSGCALLPQVDPMYGPNRVSEAVQAQRIVQQLPSHSIVMADSGFGIYSVAHHATLAGHDFLFRLTAKRFKSLRRKAEPIKKAAFTERIICCGSRVPMTARAVLTYPRTYRSKWCYMKWKLVPT